MLSFYSGEAQIVCVSPPRPAVPDTARYSTVALTVVTAAGKTAICARNGGCSVIYDPHRTPNITTTITPEIARDGLVAVKGRRLSTTRSSDLVVKIGTVRCAVYDDGSDVSMAEARGLNTYHYTYCEGLRSRGCP